jgi:hypothetical protein
VLGGAAEIDIRMQARSGFIVEALEVEPAQLHQPFDAHVPASSRFLRYSPLNCGFPIDAPSTSTEAQGLFAGLTATVKKAIDISYV